MSEQWKTDALSFIHKRRLQLLDDQRQLDERKEANDALFDKQMRAAAIALIATPVLFVAVWFLILWGQG